MEKNFKLAFTMLLSLGVFGCQKDSAPDPGNNGGDSKTKYDFNLAIGGIARASSFNPGQGAELLVDGKTIEAEAYSSINSSSIPASDHSEWVSVELTNRQKINEIWVYPLSTGIHEGFPLNFRLQVSEDGAEWETVVTEKDHPLPTSAGPVIYSFDPAEAGYVRLFADNLRPISNHWTGFNDTYLLRLSEIEVYLSSSRVSSVSLGSRSGVAGTVVQLKAAIATSQVPDGTRIEAVLVNSDETATEVKSSAEVSAGRAETTLSLPASLPAGDYRVRISGQTGNTEFTAMSEVYSILPASNRIFYVSSSGGSDSNDGLSEAKALKTLACASRLELLPGDRLLLKKGDVWENESLLPKGSGTPEKPIVISSYGTGDAMPHIKPNYNVYYGIRIVNSSGYEVSGIEVSNVIGGIVVWEEDSYDHRYIKISDCYLHDMTDQGRGVPDMVPDLLYGMGVSIAGSDNYGGRTLLSDVFIEDCRFDKCDVGIEVIGRDHDEIGRWNVHNHHKITARAFMNVNIKDCTVSRSYRSGGVMLYCITGGKAQNVTVDQTGYNGVGMWWGVCAFQCARVSDYLVEGCTFSNTIKGTSPDGQGFDWEADCHDIVVRNCRFLNNDGPATLNYGESWPGENTGCVLDGCYIEGNNRITNTNDDYYNRVFGLNRHRPANNGIIQNCEIHLRDDGQNWWSFPLVFDESNRVYNTGGELVYGGVDRTDPLFTEDFSGGLSHWENASAVTVTNGAAVIAGGQAVYASGASGWQDYFAEAHFDFTEEGSAGVVFGVSNSRSYYLLKANVRLSMISSLELSRVSSGSETVLKTIEAHGLRPGTPFSLRANIKDGEIEVYCQGSMMGRHTLAENPKGPAGLWMGREGECSVDDFFVHPLSLLSGKSSGRLL